MATTLTTTSVPPANSRVHKLAVAKVELTILSVINQHMFEIVDDLFIEHIKSTIETHVANINNINLIRCSVACSGSAATSYNITVLVQYTLNPTSVMLETVVTLHW